MFKSAHRAQSRIAAAILLAFASLDALAAPVSASIGTVTRLYVHATFGGGEVFIVGTSLAAPCQAFWIRAADPAAKNLYALVLAARAANRPLLLYAHDNELWAGSSLTTCHLEAVDFAD